MEAPLCPYPACRKVFSTPYNLKKHVEACHMKLKPFICHLCTKAFPYKHSFNHHMNLHIKCKPLTQVDSKLFTSSLKATIRVLSRHLTTRWEHLAEGQSGTIGKLIGELKVKSDDETLAEK